MRRVDKNCRYDRELSGWVRYESGLYVVGLTDWAQHVIGKVQGIYHLPKIGSHLERGMEYCVTEGDKTVTQHIIPLSATVADTNLDLEQYPHWINEYCYSKGWIVKLKNVNSAEFLNLKSADWYRTEIHSLFNKS